MSGSGDVRSSTCATGNVRFSHRPFGVKRFQTIGAGVGYYTAVIARFPPPELPGFIGNTNLSVTPRRPACPSRASGWSSLSTPWGFPCCVRFPCVHAAATTPVQRLGVFFAHPEQTSTRFATGDSWPPARSITANDTIRSIRYCKK
jgi:hypothetical protein